MVEIPKQPINLARGVPHETYRNRLMALAARELFSVDNPGGRGAYDGGVKGVESDKNAWRGDAEVLQFIQDEMLNWGLKARPEQILSGSAGAQDLTGRLLRTLNKGFVTSTRSYDRAIRLGESLPDAEQKVLYLVNPGSNPDGYTVPAEDLKEMCIEADKNGNTIVMDAAYLALYFDPQNKLDLTELQPFIDSGVFYLVRSATKEGGDRGHAYALGNEEVIERVLSARSDEHLSPNFATGLENVYYETALERTSRTTLVDLVRRKLELSLSIGADRSQAETLLAKADSEGLMGAEEFRRDVIRPGLQKAFAYLSEPLLDLDIKFSNPSVNHGYNVSLLLPEHTTDAQLDAFYSDLQKNGVLAGTLTPFTATGVPRNGFRVPFGGFSPEQCQYIGQSIADAYKKTFG